MDGPGASTAGRVLRGARDRAGISQAELARRAKVAQSVVSAYERGARQPSVPTLQRLVAATGYELDLRVRKAPSGAERLTGPLGRAVLSHRVELRRSAAERGLTNVRVFGSVARGEEDPDSDIDLLVDVAPGVGLFALAAARGEFERILDARVDLVPADGLKGSVRDDVSRDSVTL